MKPKITRGSGFRGALNYVFDIGPKATGLKKPEKVGGNMSGTTVDELVQEFAVTKKLRPDCIKPVWHCSLALPAGERLSAKRWNEITTDFMIEMGLDPANFLFDVERHNDSPYDHVHIVASRIGLDGKLWHGGKDVFTAIEAAQQLEKRHGLTLTPGLDMNEKKERKPVTHHELNMAIRTEARPPRMVCQDAIDDVLHGKGVISAPEFIVRLEALGVRAVPNIAATGTMNGYSFECEGISFTGSKLGDGYKWSKLQLKGVEYVQARDFESLANTRRLAAERVADAKCVGRDNSEAQSNAVPGAGTESVEIVARPGDRASDNSVKTTDDDAPRDSTDIDSVRPGNADAKVDAGRVGHGNQQENHFQHGAESQDTGRVDSANDSQHEHLAGGNQNSDNRANPGDWKNHSTTGQIENGFGQINERADNGNREAVNSSQQIEDGNPPSQGGIVEGLGTVDSGSNGGRNAGGNWAKRFKQASVAKKAAAANSTSTSKTIPYAKRIEARQVDPTAYLESLGYTVKKEGRHLSVQQHADEVYRITCKDDKHWVTCDKYENGIGDNIALVQELEPGTSFADAVYKLSGAPSVVIKSTSPVTLRKPPQLPIQTQLDIDNGRIYLFNRGISPEVIEYAETNGMVKYSTGCVLFAGLDESGRVQNVTRRAIETTDLIQKRDLRGSDKRHPQRLLGNPYGIVWLVEGAIDALALHTQARRLGKPTPTVLVSGGANVRSFLQTPWVQKILRFAKKVVVAFENESSAEKQIKTDAAHQVQIALIKELCSAKVEAWKPPEGVKDIAALNLIAINTKPKSVPIIKNRIIDNSYSRMRG
jgi:hypothetical protein